MIRGVVMSSISLFTKWKVINEAEGKRVLPSTVAGLES